VTVVREPSAPRPLAKTAMSFSRPPAFEADVARPAANPVSSLRPRTVRASVPTSSA
jgi:hypothetical protein